MNLAKYFLGMALTAVLIGCQPVKTTETPDIVCPPGFNCSGKQQTNITDDRVCKKAPPPLQSPLGKWKQIYYYGQDKKKIESVFYINKDFIVRENTCFVRRDTLIVEATSTLHLDSAKNELHILNEDENTARSKSDSGLLITCKASLPKEEFQVSFKGPCLILKSKKTQQEELLIPAD